MAVYYTSPQSFKISFLFVDLKTLGTFNKFLIGWFIKLSVLTFQPLIEIYRRGNFVYHHSGYTSIYRPLSYPFRSLPCKRVKVSETTSICIVEFQLL